MSSILPGPARVIANHHQALIRPLCGTQDLEQVYRLVHDGYVQRGYCSPQEDGLLRHGQHLDELDTTLTLGAFQNDMLIGTVSVTRDGDYTMPVDSVFAEEYAAIRRENASLAVIWRLATHHDYREEPRLVMNLIQAVIHHKVRSGINVSVCTLHERHERIYRRLFKMSVVGRSQEINSFDNVPAVLMRWDLKNCDSRWLPSDQSVRNDVARKASIGSAPRTKLSLPAAALAA